MGDTLREGMEEIVRYAASGGAQNALISLLKYWTDDNDVNHKMVQDLLGLAIMQGEGLE